MTSASPARAGAPAWKVWAALWIVYIVWGSTYMAIRVTVETLPPLFSAGVRFIVAGMIIYTILLARRGREGVRVSRPQLLATSLVGALLFLGANGMVAIAELDVPSSLAALIISSVPLWVILLRSLSGDRVAVGTLVGVAVGFSGVGILVLPGNRPEGATFIGVVLLVIASASWALGSFLSTRLEMPRDLMVSSAYQMIGGGIALIVAGFLRGEASGFDSAEWSRGSVVALAYLVVFGSLVAFTAYAWLLQNAPISKVSTYAYVNPVVAIFLGWAFLNESITPNTLLGAAVIVGSVAFIVRKEAKPERAPEPGVALAGAESA